MTPLTLKANVVHCPKGSCDRTPSYIYKTKRHLAVRVQEHISVKSEKSASHEHISSSKTSHTCPIINVYTLAQTNTDFETKINNVLYI